MNSVGRHSRYPNIAYILKLLMIFAASIYALFSVVRQNASNASNTDRLSRRRCCSTFFVDFPSRRSINFLRMIQESAFDHCSTMQMQLLPEIVSNLITKYFVARFMKTRYRLRVCVRVYRKKF